MSRQHTPRILIAEDEVVFRLFLKEVLEENGYQVMEASNGEEAISHLGKHQFDLVITDISMPKVTGIDVLRYAKNHQPDVEVIIMTANGRLETAVESLRLGAYDYIIKPFEDIEIVLRLINHTLERQTLQLENKNLLKELMAKNKELEDINRSYRAIHDETTALYHLGKTINSTLKLDQVLSMIVKVISELTNPTKGMLLLFNKNSGILYGDKCVGLDESVFSNFKIPLDKNWIENNPIWYLNFHELPEIVSRLKEDLGIEHFIHAPLTMRDEVYGILIAAYDSPKAITPREQSLLMQFASHAAIACENAKLHQLTEELSIRDGLTGSYNHRFFQERLNQELLRARRYKEPICLLMIDIDHFKAYNDTNGHPKGDIVLKTIVELVSKSIRNTDILARYGGEEFTVILPNTDLRGGLITAEKLRSVIDEHKFEGEESQPLGKVTISVGLAGFPMHCTTIAGLIEYADKALYHAKNSARNRVCNWEDIKPAKP